MRVPIFFTFKIISFLRARIRFRPTLHLLFTERKNKFIFLILHNSLTYVLPDMLVHFKHFQFQIKSAEKYIFNVVVVTLYFV